MYCRTGKTNDASICYSDMLIQSIEWLRYTVKTRVIDKSKQVCVVGYKGGNFESRLCEALNVLLVNIEFVDCPKYVVLKEHYKVRDGFCCKQYHGCVTGKSINCCRMEIVLFSCFMLEKRNIDYVFLLLDYGCC